MSAEPPLLLALDLTGTFAFALNGALTALRVARLDIVGVGTLGIITAIGGGVIRDVLLGALPPATFSDWRFLAVAAVSSFVAFGFGRGLAMGAAQSPALVAAGLSLFAVSGALKGLDFGVGPAQAVILGAITGVGGGTLRDVLIREIPAVLTSGLYAIPALVGACVVVVAHQVGTPDVVAAVVAAGSCFAIRMVGVHLGLDAPGPPDSRRGA